MKILQICPSSYGMGGGVSEYVQNISERLAKRHEVTVYTTNIKNKQPQHDVINGVEVERFGRIAPNHSYFFSLGMMIRLSKASFDIVHAHNYHALPLHFSSLSDCRRLILSAHFHGSGHSAFRDVLLKLFKPFGKNSLRKADVIVAVSDYEKHLLQKYFDLDPSKIVVIPCGLKLADFSDTRRHLRDFKLLLYVGRLERYKGIHYVVEALPYLNGEAVLEIVGDGSLRLELEKRAKELGVSHRIRFYQNLPRKELLQKYADADLFVLLSRHEAYSMVVAESLASGTPCIVANTSALQEWIDNENCFGVDLPIDIKRLVRTINNAFKIDATKRSVPTKLSPKILDWDEVVARLETIYEWELPIDRFWTKDWASKDVVQQTPV